MRAKSWRHDVSTSKTFPFSVIDYSDDATRVALVDTEVHALLMAAAPELLATLEWILPSLKSMHDDAEYGCDSEISRVEAAIRKAKGEPEPEPFNQSLALAEGWCMMDEDSYPNIQADDDSSAFKTDDDAIAHVRRLAAAGSLYHRRAIEMHDEGARARDNDPDW